MSRAYNVIDADGHILEPLDLWEKYIDPKFRDRAPKIVKGENGKDQLVIEEHQVGISRIGAVGARQGVVEADTMARQARRFRSAQAHPGHGRRRHRRRLSLSEPRSVRGRDPRSRARRRHLPRLQPLAS